MPSVPIFSLNFQPKEYFDGEDIWFLVENLMREFYESTVSIEVAKNTKLFEGSEHTTEDFAIDILSFLSDNCTYNRAETDLMMLLNKHFPEKDPNTGETKYNLPVRLTQKKTWNSNLKKYTTSDLGVLSFDICEAGCTVYVGEEADFCNADVINPTTKCIEKCGIKRTRHITDNLISYRPFGVILQRLLCSKILSIIHQ